MTIRSHCWLLSMKFSVCKKASNPYKRFAQQRTLHTRPAQGSSPLWQVLPDTCGWWYRRSGRGTVKWLWEVNPVLRKTLQCLSWNLLGSDMTDGKELLKEQKNLWFVGLQDQSHPWPRLCLEAQTQQGRTGLACLHKGLVLPLMMVSDT